MKKETTKMLTGTLITAAILNVASMKASNANLFEYTLLGTGSEVRSVVLNCSTSAVKFSDLCCGYKDTKTMKKAQRKARRSKFFGRNVPRK